MTDVFLKLVNMSIAAGWLVLAVLLLRLLLRKAPKWIFCLLWGLVALRLMVPTFLPNLFSLIPSAQVIPQDIAVSSAPAIHSAIVQVDTAVNPLFTQQMIRGVDSRQSMLLALACIWVLGAALMLLYSAATYLRLRLQVRASITYRKNVYICDDVGSPFILGIFCPRIYVHSGMDEQQLEYVLAHENAHLKRRDHWWKPLGFLLLSIYWFHPLLWLAYILLCRDIEKACDEKVIAGMETAGIKGYSEALIACSVHRRTILVCPVAFGEVSVKSRIKSIIRYKKPGIWIVGISVLACMLTAACFLTDPVPCVHTYQSQITLPATCTQKGMQTLTCSACRHSYTLPVELIAHTYDSGMVTKAPTCTQLGARKYSCTGCTAEKTEPVAMVAHTAGTLTVTKEPNCTQTGEATSVCTQCQTVFVAQILETNDVHDLKQTVTVPATCSKEGTALHSCTRCTYQETQTVEKKKHTYKEEILSVGITCGSVWSIRKECTVCGYEKLETKTTMPKEHTWSEPDDYGNRRCTECGDVRMGGGSRNLLDNTVGNTKPAMPEDLFPVIRLELARP